RVTKPFTEEAWARIMSVGEAVDADLRKNDVRLTMGGEPTFVSIDDMEGAEWNTEAMGPTKRKLAENLLLRLKDRWAVGPLLHYGMGKWYPGESLPRWAMSCIWRADGHPIWHDPDLIAPETGGQHGIGQARALSDAIARALGIEPKFLLTAYE